MSVEYFDLGQRLHAASTGRPTPRSCYAPCAVPVEPVAVTVSRATGGELVVHAATAEATATARGDLALTALAQVDVSLSDTVRTVIVPDRPTLAVLASAARQSVPGSASAEQAAAAVAWWDQRADHPGSGAVLSLARTCALRWALGTLPSAEREIGSWLSWLAVPGNGPEALLALAELVSAGPTLPGLDVARDAQSLRLVIEDAMVRAGALVVGNLVTLRATPVNPNQQKHGRRNLRVRYTSGGNWLGTGAPPVIRRRDVPLDIVIAAADD